MIIYDGKRLMYFSKKANTIFWDCHWLESINLVEWKKSEQGLLGWFEKPFTTYLPKNGKVLEAGCGLGYYVLALEQRGYDIEGVEWSKEAVDVVKKYYPRLKVKRGDVKRLPVKDNYYSAYISLGVVEHSQSGPKKYLQEAYRVLKPGGVAFISVPHFNMLRRIKSLLGLYRGNPEGLDFYQYAFTEAEIGSIVRKSGFRILDHFRYDAYKGLREEIPMLKYFLSTRFMKQKVMTEEKNGTGMKEKKNISFTPNRPLYLRVLDFLFGHMTMVICEKV